MNRRGFLGGLAGAAAAGPNAVRNAISGQSYGLPPSGILTSGSMPQEADVAYQADRIRQLRKWISGETSEPESRKRERSLMSMEKIETARLEAMRSISNQHKVRMYLERDDWRHKQLQKIWWQSELDNLLGM